MKRLAAFVVLAALSASFSLPAYANTKSRAQDRRNNQALDRDSRKAERRQQKAQKKYAKAQRKAERKMLKVEKKNTTYKPHRY